MNKYFKQYKKDRFKEALKRASFDPDGNSPLATVNQSFFIRLKNEIKYVNSEIRYAVDWKELFIQLVNLITLILMPVIYVPLVLFFAFMRKVNANKELMKSFERDFERINEEKIND